MPPFKAKKPAPFARPSVDLGGEKREWRDVQVKDVGVGDNVPGIGLITDITKIIADDHELIAVILYGAETDRKFSPDDVVFAFVPVEGK